MGREGQGRCWKRVSEVVPLLKGRGPAPLLSHFSSCGEEGSGRWSMGSEFFAFVLQREEPKCAVRITGYFLVSLMGGIKKVVS